MKRLTSQVNDGMGGGARAAPAPSSTVLRQSILAFEEQKQRILEQEYKAVMGNRAPSPAQEVGLANSMPSHKPAAR